MRKDAAVSSFRIVVLASGSGTNLQAILDQLHGEGLVEVVGVGSDKPGAGALERAARAGVDTAVFPAESSLKRWNTSNSARASSAAVGSSRISTWASRM